MKPAYKLFTPLGELPYIEKVRLEDLEGGSWRDAKKALRQWYLDQAASLRSMSAKDYFEEEAFHEAVLDEVDARAD